MKKILIDTDPGIDDSVAILFALGSPALDVLAITTVSGNLTADRCSTNARKILQLPVARGMLHPLTRPYPHDPFSHGDNGLGDVVLPEPAQTEDSRFAPELIRQTVNAHAGDITLVCLGPLTNIALAFMHDPELPAKVCELILVGGSYGFDLVGARHATGDNPSSEWNIFADPEAAKIVFEAGFRITAIGLDVATGDNLDLSEEVRGAIEANPRPQAKFLCGIIDFVERRGFKTYCALIDSLAIATAIDPAVINVEEVNVGVETEGTLTRGQTVVDRRENFRWEHLPRIRAAKSLDEKRFFNLLLAALLQTKSDDLKQFEPTSEGQP
jgi:inosine-uridine nucleoside N-ribohydrolase